MSMLRSRSLVSAFNAGIVKICLMNADNTTQV